MPKPNAAAKAAGVFSATSRNRQNGRRVVDEDLVSGFPSGRDYVNVHTAKNSAGEIRGQLRRVGR